MGVFRFPPTYMIYPSPLLPSLHPTHRQYFPIVLLLSMRGAVIYAALAVVVLGLFPAAVAAQCNSTALANCPEVVLEDDATNSTYSCESFLRFEACAKRAECSTCKSLEPKRTHSRGERERGER